MLTPTQARKLVAFRVRSLSLKPMRASPLLAVTLRTDDRPMSGIGLPWYRREDYAEITQVMEGSAKYPPRFDAWLIAAEKVLARYEKKGIVVHKVLIDPKTFPAWCRARGLRINSTARMVFANEHVAGIGRDRH